LSSESGRATTFEDLPQGVLRGDRRALARAITLIESERVDHRAAAESVLAMLLPHTGRSIRIGISGAPGVGKSTFIEALGMYLIGQRTRPAVLAVDPSSQLSGGSILGDKTRMERLSRDEMAFVRPSPAGESLGGVARHTRDAILLCEAAGYDVVMVETVGVGQSEAAVAEMVDLFILLLAPGAGDELQGIKRGIVELAELIVVNKHDGDLMPAANRIAGEYKAALGLLRPLSAHWMPEVHLCSALEARGIGEIWRVVERHHEAMQTSGELDRRRQDQTRRAMWREVSEALLSAIRVDRGLASRAEELEQRVMAGDMAPGQAARLVVEAFRQ